MNNVKEGVITICLDSRVDSVQRTALLDAFKIKKNPKQRSSM